jgi:arylsulfatase A-like enzyme
MVHWPHAASDEFLERSPANPYRAAVEEIDWSVGRIMQIIENLDLADNTLVVFTSDNGGDGGPYNLRHETATSQAE